MDEITKFQGKRVTLKRSRPNPLLEEWLTDLHEEAKAKKSKLESMLKEALESLSKYPLPLSSGAECAVLKGFDKKLCIFLDRRIEAYNSQQDATKNSTSSTSKNVISVNDKPQNNGSSRPDQTTPLSSQTSSSSGTENASSQNNMNVAPEIDVAPLSKKGKERKYKPVFRSGGYAILVALLEHEIEKSSCVGLKKEELIEKAQKHSEESFTRPKPESFYTAWSSMSTLVTKGLVKSVRCKKTDYFLTEAGRALALELLEDAKNTPTANDIIFNGASVPSRSVSSNPVSTTSSSQISGQSSQGSVSSVSQPLRVDSEVIFVDLPAGSFEVILLIDKNETGGVNNKKDPTVAQFNKYPDLKHEYRSLKVGDFTWIARHREKKDIELVLPYVVERKRMDDFGASIKDGRFHEQKFRLRKCGLPNVLYLVEHFGSNKHVGLPIQSLMQALANTRIQDGFKVHITDSLTNTARFLAMMTKRLTIEYKDKHLKGSNSDPEGEVLMTLEYFNKSSMKSKPLTVTETFIKLLLQLKGVSVEKALAITKIYNTPRSLIKQYEGCSQKEGELLLASLKFGELNRNVGPSVSKSIYKFFVWRG